MKGSPKGRKNVKSKRANNKQDGIQNGEISQRYHVGRLLHEDGVYTFSYETKGYRRKLKEAMDNGYRPHLAFPDTNMTYTSNVLFGPFARRLPDSRRPDYSSVLRELGLSAECTEMDVLRENDHDNKAIVVMSVNEEKLGYIPAFYSSWMYEVIEKSCNYQAKVWAVHPQAVPHRKVNISIVGEINHFMDIQELLNDKEELRLVMC
ncbi:HIRAN domain-containing protein [Pontibacillus litoralis]|uniref:DNA-binding protein n=1 Tax=Pontibacillus litoralis JSM 072002 TaxID=1385512 RepID=A0A0A5GAI9_9BACI|nr:HIRAN domain-containing protein [Pontibacillus litoralis]KGX88218.1 DNA-binding protein [Pontibacillus litoralis JSM 072002]